MPPPRRRYPQLRPQLWKSPRQPLRRRRPRRGRGRTVPLDPGEGARASLPVVVAAALPRLPLRVAALYPFSEARARRTVCRAGTTPVFPERTLREAHVPAQQPEAGHQPWLPPPHVHPRRTGHPEGSTPQGSPPPFGLSGDHRPLAGARSRHVPSVAPVRSARPSGCPHRDVPARARGRSAGAGVRHRPERRSRGGEKPPTSPVAGAVRRAVARTPSRYLSGGSRSRRCHPRSRRTPNQRVHRPFRPRRRIVTVPARVLRALCRMWQVAMSGRPSPCRFTPTCSTYAIEALTTHGALRGGALTLRRLSHCHPWGPFGFDPVPERRAG